MIIKKDEVFESHTGVVTLNEQFFELGRLLGKNLMYLEPPTYAQCLTIGLPEHQHGTKQYTGDLHSLLSLIRSLNSESSCIILGKLVIVLLPFDLFVRYE